MDDNNGTIIRNILHGNPRGLNRLLARYGHDLAEYVRAIVGDDDAMFALVYEDVLVGILRHIRGAGDHPDALRRHLFESAARTVRKHYQQMLKQPGEEQGGASSVDEIASVVQADPAAMRHAIKGLSPLERELLVLRYRLGFSYNEISDIIKEARVQLEDRLHAARTHFRTRMVGAMHLS